jgi:hypothetical protein
MVESIDSINSILREYASRDYALLKYRSVWVINYSLLFFACLSFWNHRKGQHRPLGFINLGLSLLALLVFLTQGLYLLSELLQIDSTSLRHNVNVEWRYALRYLSIVLVFVSVKSMSSCLQAEFMATSKRTFLKAVDLFKHLVVLWVVSSELILWLHQFNFHHSYKLGLSILWGTYALLLVVLGIWKKKQYLRIGAIALFGVTLIKLFFYDISNLSTISKTIVFVALGGLLLVISFLYNKFKILISEEDVK